MLAANKPRRKPSSREELFLAPAWDDHHPDYRRIDSTLPPDHHARWLVHVVSRLDLTALRRSYGGYGSLACPVEPLLAFVLFMYSKGLLSPAQWANQARYDDQSKWLLRGLRLSRSQFYSFRDRLEPFLDDWHKQLIAWAVAQRLTTASRGSLDGTFVAALASRHQLMTPRRLARRLLLLRLLVWLGPTTLEDLPCLALTTAALHLALVGLGLRTPAIEQTLLNLMAILELLSPESTGSWQPRLPSWVPATLAGRQRVLRRYEDAWQRLAQRLAPYQGKNKLSKKDLQTIKRMKVSLTDPTAALGWDKMGTYRPLYNVPLVQATDLTLTLSWDVLSRNNDDGLLRPMMQRSKGHLGKHLDEVLVDGAFLSVGEVAWCEKEGITVYGGPAKGETVKTASEKEQPSEAVGPTAEDQKATRRQQQGGSAKKQEKLSKEAFRYDSGEKVYYCPEGKRLEAVARGTVKRESGIELGVIIHRASGEDCQVCPRQKGCTSNPKKGRVVKRYQGEEALERLRQRMAQPASQEVYRLRKRTVELGYADLKQHRGLRSFRGFGIKRARVQAGLVILACNGLNIVRALQRRQHQSSNP